MLLVFRRCRSIFVRMSQAVWYSVKIAAAVSKVKARGGLGSRHDSAALRIEVEMEFFVAIFESKNVNTCYVSLALLSCCLGIIHLLLFQHSILPRRRRRVQESRRVLVAVPRR